MMANYRLRTWARERAPGFLSRLFPYPADCGEHEWYRFGETDDGCRHCLTNRPHEPMPIDFDSALWRWVRERAATGDHEYGQIVRRMLAEHEQYHAARLGEMRETAELVGAPTDDLAEEARIAARAASRLAT